MLNLILLPAFLLVGCGGQSSFRSGAQQPQYLFNNTEASYPAPAGNAGESSGSTSKTKTKAPESFRVGAVGYTSTTVTVKALKTLKVKFTPGIQDQAIEDTQNYPHYSGLGVFITVGTKTQSTPLLYNGLWGGSPQSTIIDFSSALPEIDGTSPQSITIKISQPNSDYWCISFGTGCPWSHVSDSHPWHGTLTVQTDDTDSL